jgi:DNA repair exonuclease SbcCD ATPase subunit
MSIHFKTLRYKNILSTGNNFIEMQLDKNALTMLTGRNGHGKSTVTEALSFVLYGKPLRKINKSQLVNAINQKNLLVEIEFNSFGEEYLVRRGMKPNLFEIFKNGKMLEQEAATRDQQIYLEENILKIDYKSFNQIVMLGSVKYTPFMQLDASSRREVIEDLLDIKVFGVMSSLLKERVSTNKNAIIQNKADIEVLEKQIEMAKKYNKTISNMKIVEVEKLKSQISECVRDIEEEDKNRLAIIKDINAIRDSIGDEETARKKLSGFKTVNVEIGHKIRLICEEVDFYGKHDNCPTCRQAIDEKFKTLAIEEKINKKSELEEASKSLGDKMKKFEERISEISKEEQKVRVLENFLAESVTKIRLLKSKASQLAKELTEKENSANVNREYTSTYDLEKQLEEKIAERQSLSDEKDSISVLSAMLKDGGIKSAIIKQYIPVINSMINKYLSDFELFVDFNLDENFNETIKSRFRDTFSYDSFSEGEKLRIDLSILFTWRALAKMKNSVSTNLLILDEVIDGGTDNEGVEALIDILNRMESKDNIFIISHRGHLFQDRVPNVIHFEKVKNFSQIREE